MAEEELSEAEIATLKARLESLAQELREALEGSRESAKVVSLDQPIGRVSRIDAIQQQRMAEASRAQQEVRLGQVQVALSSIERGEYGLCRSCEEPIGLRRLRARPESPLCVHCQSGREDR